MSGSTATETGSATVVDRVAEAGVRRFLLYVVLVLMIGFYLIPLETGLMTSLKTEVGVTKTTPFMPPGPAVFTLSNWEQAFAELGKGLVNSLIMTLPATALGAFLGSLTAYGITKADWRGQSLVLALLVAGIFIPYQSVLIPLSRFWAVYANMGNILAPVWGLPFLTREHANLLELTFTHTAYGIPLMTLLFRSHYNTISDDLMEAAKIDGASFARIFRKIILPLSTPMFAVTLIFQFTQIWNDLLFALILVSSESSPVAPVTLLLSGLGRSQSGTNFGLVMAGALITALPPLIVYVFFGDEFAEGVAT